MRKKIFALGMALCLALCLSVPALGAQDYGLIYDATDLLDGQTMSTLANDTFYPLSEKYKVQVRVDVVSNLEGETIENYAQIFYDNYSYGYDDSGSGILLMLYVLPNDAGDLDFGGYTLLPGGTAVEALGDAGMQTLQAALDIMLNEQSFSGGMESDEGACESAFTSFAATVDALLGGGEVSAAAPTPESGTSAESETTQNVLAYVTDSAGILTAEEAASLEATAQALSSQYGCGVYAVTVDDFTTYTQEGVYECATEIFQYYDLGYGDTRDGVLLLLSMEDRDYALISHGDFGNAAFTDYGKDVLSEEFIDNFGDDDWYGGFSDYLTMVGTMMEAAQNGEPVDVGSDIGGGSVLKGLPPAIFFGFVVAIVICLNFKNKMKTARKATAAQEYVTPNGVRLIVQEDRYTHTTQIRENIEKEKGGTSVDSGGFSGKSGKF